MTQNEKRMEFDSKVKGLIDKGYGNTEMCEILGCKMWAIQNAKYRLQEEMNTKNPNDRLNVDDFLETKLVFGDSSRHKVGETVVVAGKKYQDVSSFFGI